MNKKNMSFIVCGALSLFLPLLGVKNFENRPQKTWHKRTKHHNELFQKKIREAFKHKIPIPPNPSSCTPLYYYPHNFWISGKLPSMIPPKQWDESYGITLIDLLKYATQFEQRKYTFKNYNVIEKEVPKGERKAYYKCNNQKHVIEKYTEKTT